jgi:hypothetical protein
VLIAVAFALTAARAPLVVAGTNSIPATTAIATTYGGAGVGACQGGETIPQGTTAARLWISGNIEPQVRVGVLVGNRVVDSGVQGGGWLAKVVTVPLARVRRTLRGARLCFSIGRGVQDVELIGAPSSHREHGGYTNKLRVEYLRPGTHTWWSLAGSMARRMGLGRAPAGRLVFLLPLAAMALAVLLASWRILRQFGRDRDLRVAPIAGAQAPAPQLAARRTLSQTAPGRVGQARGAPRGGRGRRLRTRLRGVPGPAWTCACVAFLSAASWSIVTPPFQAPDEPSHFAYVQILAENKELPKSGASYYSDEERAVLVDLDHQGVRFNKTVGTISSGAQQRRLEHDLSRPLSRLGHGAGVASPQPPLYYALLTIPYYLGGSGTLLDQLALMRLLSALMAGVAAFFVFMFLREALPAVPWAWTVGGLCAAFAPLLGFISGMVNPDAMLCTVATVLFYCLARGFRRGLTPRLAIAIGALTAIGFLTKLNFIGLAPGVLFALVLLARRAARMSGRSAYGSLAAAVAIGWGPVCLYGLVNVLSGHAAFGLFSHGLLITSAHQGSPLQELEYIWQFYLPRLPGMADYFPGILTTRQFWFDRPVGVYGWLDTIFPGWVYNVALIPAGLIAALCVRELLRARGALRARAGELLSYAAIGAGLLALMGADSYLEFPTSPGVYSEPRYLLPLAAIAAAVVALAARGAGRRWGPAVGTLLVMLILAHDIFSQLLEIGRFYT